MREIDVVKFFEENKINTVEVGFADINGILRGKRLPALFF